MRAPTLQSQRLTLTPFGEEGFEELVGIWTNPKVVWWRDTPMTRREIRAAFEQAVAQQAEGFGWWFLREPGGPALGVAALRPLPDTPWIEVGYHLTPEARGKGFATEAARTLLAYGFRTLELPEIHAIVLPSNAPSQAVMARLGMARIGLHTHSGMEHDLFRMREREWAASL